MNESSKTFPENSALESDPDERSIAHLEFSMKSGKNILKVEEIKSGEFEKFRESILEKISQEGCVWFYLIDGELSEELKDPNIKYNASLVRIDEIESLHITLITNLENKGK